ncbi:minor allergen Alt a 7 [Aspergillus pseudoviridinutans]|uniref:Minor allergen Alt a 7 n=1 Tax=Aspergillus pseudoviridinutans TaxID=1517512 RepID=A0A9P3BKZ3_9EURO|nr:minor allergen Alt a 7 [Aspergillus pseudoviridinutans]GIJ91245.1 minor allergen Alt a 7 [Aspergillus pseudoviridinutans]
MVAKIAIVYYSLYGHIQKLAEAEQEGIIAAGGQADIYQIAETLPQDVLSKMHAPSKSLHPIIEPDQLLEYDGVLFGIPTRFGNFPAQWRAFWDKTGRIWTNGGYWGKYAGLFVSTGTQGGGQESTAIAAMSTLAHHGFIYVPLGYKTTFSILSNTDQLHGGSPWGAGSFAGADGSRQPTQLELDIAVAQGEAFFRAVSKGQ